MKSVLNPLPPAFPPLTTSCSTLPFPVIPLLSIRFLPRSWRKKDGLRLLGKGEIKTKINITVYSASASAVAAVEKAGGKVTTTKKEAPAEEA